jgi:hypothetical protein
MMSLRQFALVAALLAMAACRPLSLYMVQPSGPPEYKLGWEDGCDTGLAAQGGMVAKATYGFKKRPEYLDNSLYNTAWNEGFTYCRFSLDPVDKSQWFN